MEIELPNKSNKCLVITLFEYDNKSTNYFFSAPWALQGPVINARMYVQIVFFDVEKTSKQQKMNKLRIIMYNISAKCNVNTISNTITSEKITM